MAPYIIGAVVVVIIGAIIAYYIARFMKGKLTLELSRNAAASGESLSGRVDVEAKKAMRGLLKVSLVGREKRKTRSHSSNNHSTEWVEVYRQDQILEETCDFPAGFSHSYDFEIIAPTSEQARQGGGMLKAAAEKAGDGMMGSMMKMAASAADMMQGGIYWHAEARMDVDGVDLYTKEKVNVNLH